MPGAVRAMDCLLEGLAQALAEVDAAVLAEGGDGLAGLRIEAVEKVEDAGEEAGLFAVSPPGETTRRLGEAEVAGAVGAEAGVEGPEEFAGGGVKGDDFERRGKGEEGTACDERVGLDAAFFAGVECPGGAEAADVGAVNLAQRRVVVAILVAVVSGPGYGLGRGDGGRKDEKEDEAESGANRHRQATFGDELDQEEIVTSGMEAGKALGARGAVRRSQKARECGLMETSAGTFADAESKSAGWVLIERRHRRLRQRMRLSAEADFNRRVAPRDLPELMDGACSYEEFHACMRSLEQVNRWLLGYRPTLEWLGRMPRGLRDPVHILDVGCGGGDLLRQIAKWARRRGVAVRMTGIDMNPHATRAAAEFTPKELGIMWVNGDALVYRPERPVDLVVSSLTAHHLEDEEIVTMVRWMETTARVGWLVNDLERSERNSRMFALLSRLARWHRFVQHDGPVSFRRAFRKEDWVELLAGAGIPKGSATIEHWRPGRLCVGRWK